MMPIAIAACTAIEIHAIDGDSARGDYMGDYPGVVRPVVDWTTKYNPMVTTESLSLDELAAS